MKRRMGLTGEASDHKLAGIFSDAQRLTDCRREMVDSIAGIYRQIERVDPTGCAEVFSLEPEPRGIWSTIIRAHLWLALAGALVGLLILALMLSLGVPFVAQNVGASSVLLVVFCALGGALIGGVVSMPPDHVPYISKVRTALDDQRHVLIVHATSRDQFKAAGDCLERFADHTVSTL